MTVFEMQNQLKKFPDNFIVLHHNTLQWCEVIQLSEVIGFLHNNGSVLINSDGDDESR
jgi:hypothetical protein